LTGNFEHSAIHAVIHQIFWCLSELNLNVYLKTDVGPSLRATGNAKSAKLQIAKFWGIPSQISLLIEQEGTQGINLSHQKGL